MSPGAPHIVRALGDPHDGMPPPPVPFTRQVSAHGNGGQIPAVYIPGQNLQPVRPIVPQLQAQNINAVHALLADKMAKQAYKHVGEVVTVEFRLGQIRTGKSSKAVIGVGNHHFHLHH